MLPPIPNSTYLSSLESCPRNELYKKSKRNWKDRDLEYFANVKVYLRKWVSEAFAGVLGGDVLLYVWDLVSLSSASRAQPKT